METYSAVTNGPSRALHPNSDELFMVLDGELTIELRDGNVVLGPRDVYVIPKGVEHRPVAEVETSIMMGRTARCARRPSDFVAAGLRPGA